MMNVNVMTILKKMKKKNVYYQTIQKTTQLFIQTKLADKDQIF